MSLTSFVTAKSSSKKSSSEKTDVPVVHKVTDEAFHTSGVAVLNPSCDRTFIIDPQEVKNVIILDHDVDENFKIVLLANADATVDPPAGHAACGNKSSTKKCSDSDDSNDDDKCGGLSKERKRMAARVGHEVRITNKAREQISVESGDDKFDSKKSLRHVQRNKTDTYLFTAYGWYRTQTSSN